MSESAVAPRIVFDWEPVRDAFITRTPTPTYTELSTEFKKPLSSVSRIANEENWPDIRARMIEQRLKEAGASELILKAIQGEGALVQQCRSLATQVVSCAESLVQAVMNEENKPSTRAATLNNLCFALANLSRFIESVGLVGMPQDLRNSKRNSAGNDAGQPWEKGMLQQINVTVNTLKQEGEKLAAQAKAESAEEVKTGPAGSF